MFTIGKPPDIQRPASAPMSRRIDPQADDVKQPRTVMPQSCRPPYAKLAVCDLRNDGATSMR